MNSYTKHFANTLNEINAFAQTEEGSKYDKAWYDQIISLVEKISTQSTDEAAEHYLDILMRSIVDSGPLNKGFAPSIDKAANAMNR